MLSRIRTLVRNHRGVSGDFGLVAQIAGFAAVSGVAILCLCIRTRGQPPDSGTIRAKVVVAENLLFASASNDIGLSAAPGPADIVALTFRDAKRSSLLRLGVLEDGTAGVQIEEEVEKTKSRLGFSVPRIGPPIVIVLVSPLDKGRMTLTVDAPEGMAAVRFRAGDRFRMSLSASEPPEPFGLVLAGRQEKPAVLIGVSGSFATLNLCDNEGHPMTSLSFSPETGPFLMWSDRAGRATIELFTRFTRNGDETKFQLVDPATRKLKVLD